MARPSDYNYDLCIEICDKVADGQNIKRILESKETYPHWTTFRRWKQNKDELRTLYINSQQDKAIALESEMDDLKDMLLAGEIDASTYNVLVQTLKWKMAKFYPKVFGDNKYIETNDVSEKSKKIIVKIKRNEDT